MGLMTKAVREKQTDSNNYDAKVERVFKRLFPALKGLGPQLERLFNEFDPATPRATIAKGKKVLDTYLTMDPVKGRFLFRLLKLVLHNGLFKDHLRTQLDLVIRAAKNEAERDSRYSLLLRLMHEVEQIRPMGSYIVMHRHANPEESFLRQMDPLSDLEAARNSSGERRFNHTIEGLRRTVEHLYDPYIRTLVFLSYVRDKKSERDFNAIHVMNLGVALEHLKSRLPDYSGLFDTRAAWFRNAVTHEILEYDPETDKLILKGRDRSAVVTTDELLLLVESWYQLSAKTIVFVSQLYLFREVFRDTGFFDLCFEFIPRMALASDPVALESIESEFGERIEGIFGTT